MSRSSEHESGNSQISCKRTLHRLALRLRAAVVRPHRAWCMRGRMANQTAPMNVLFYHRVSNRHANDWTISVRQFRRHVEHCRRHLEPVDLAEVQQRVRAGKNPRPTFTFTFDDGYAENMDHAIPLLLEHSVPTTYFVTTRNVLDGSPFPHDVDCGRPLPVNTVNHVREMSDAGIEIGLHTRTHPDFANLNDPDRVREEIHGGKQELEDMIGRRVRFFAVPYGLPKQLTRLVFETSREAGLQGVCSAYGGYNIPGGDDYHLRRFHGDPEYGRLMNWLSLDPSKLRKEPFVDSCSEDAEHREGESAQSPIESRDKSLDDMSSDPNITEANTSPVRGGRCENSVSQSGPPITGTGPEWTSTTGVGAETRS